MTTTDQEQLDTGKGAAQAEVGEDVYSSWFARMELDGIEGDTVSSRCRRDFSRAGCNRITPRSCSPAGSRGAAGILRIELTVRSAVIRHDAAKAEAASRLKRSQRVRPRQGQWQRPAPSAAPISAVHDALGGSPLDPRLTFDTFVVGRSNTLAHAAAKQVAQGRRGDR